MYIIETKWKDGGTEWIPVSIELPKKLPSGRYERKYHYDTEKEAEDDLTAFCKRHPGPESLGALCLIRISQVEPKCGHIF